MPCPPWPFRPISFDLSDRRRKKVDVGGEDPFHGPFFSFHLLLPGLLAKRRREMRPLDERPADLGSHRRIHGRKRTTPQASESTGDRFGRILPFGLRLQHDHHSRVCLWSDGTFLASDDDDPFAVPSGSFSPSDGWLRGGMTFVFFFSLSLPATLRGLDPARHPFLSLYSVTQHLQGGKLKHGECPPNTKRDASSRLPSFLSSCRAGRHGNR